MKKLNLKDKIKLTSGQDSWYFLESRALNSTPFRVADGPHGVRVYQKKVTHENILDTSHVAPATLFPSASLMASTWQPDLLEKVGKTIARECRYYGIDGLLGPGINLKRSPLGGRNFEYYSEDPFLTKEMAVGFVKGVQSEGVKACIKHFGMNEQETMRRFVDTVVDERTMHELYLYPFKKVIEEANPGMIMSAYNKVNKEYASESKYLLKDVLRDQWLYDGVVVSDWGAVQNKVKSIKNGMNVEMPGPSSFEKELFEALEKGDLTEKELDDSLVPLLKLKETHQLKPLNDISFDDHHLVAKQVADQGIVLLENDGVLPLDKNVKMGVIGAFAKEPRINGGGSATVKPYKVDTPYAYLKSEFSQLMYAQGYDEDTSNDRYIKEVKEVADKSDVLVYFTGTTASQETEGMDRISLKIPDTHQNILDILSGFNKKVVVILSNGSALDLRQIKAKSNAILETWFLGGAGGQSLVDILLGRINPSGRLQETFPLKLEHTPHYPIFPQRKTVYYHQDLIMNGYRYYDTHDYEVMYPFGYGLSYSNIQMSNVQIGDYSKGQVSIDLSLENKSHIGGYEVVQIYIRDHSKDYITPKHALRQFKKVWVDAQSSQSVTLVCDQTCFETYDVTTHAFCVYNGHYTIEVARHSRDILAHKSIAIEDANPYIERLDLNFPYHYFEDFYPDLAKDFEMRFRPLQWYDKEEPFIRLIKRYQRHKKIEENDIKRYIKSIEEAINHV